METTQDLPRLVPQLGVVAEKVIRLSGFEPHEEIPIVVTGRRPGEKRFEEVGSDAEGLHRTEHPKILIGTLQPYEPARLAPMSPG